jgi:hypothetical protein
VACPARRVLLDQLQIIGARCGILYDLDLQRRLVFIEMLGVDALRQGLSRRSKPLSVPRRAARQADALSGRRSEKVD